MYREPPDERTARADPLLDISGLFFFNFSDDCLDLNGSRGVGITPIGDFTNPTFRLFVVVVVVVVVEVVFEVVVDVVSESSTGTISSSESRELSFCCVDEAPTKSSLSVKFADK